MTSFAQSERAGLCDTFLAVGPDAPTLSGQWRTRDLAAHLVVRETRPDAALGMFVPPLAGHLQSVQDRTAAQDWEQLVQQVRGGPPRWSAFALPGVDELANLMEFFIHHEDVLRAQPDFVVRPYDLGLQRALYGAIPRLASMTTRGLPVGLVVVCPGFGRRTIHRARPGHGQVTLLGAPSEIALAIYGRGAVAVLEADGEASDLAEYEHAKLGI